MNSIINRLRSQTEPRGDGETEHSIHLVSRYVHMRAVPVEARGINTPHSHQPQLELHNVTRCCLRLSPPSLLCHNIFCHTVNHYNPPPPFPQLLLSGTFAVATATRKAMTTAAMHSLASFWYGLGVGRTLRPMLTLNKWLAPRPCFRLYVTGVLICCWSTRLPGAFGDFLFERKNSCCFPGIAGLFVFTALLCRLLVGTYTRSMRSEKLG